MTDAVRRALEFAAEHMHSDWPERCQEIVRRARAALSEQPSVATVTECEACLTPDVCRLRGTCDHYAAERLRVAAHPAPVERVTLSDEQVLACIRSAQVGPVPMGMTLERGPYDVTEPTYFAQRFARAVIAEYERLSGISATPRQPLSEAQIAAVLRKASERAGFVTLEAGEPSAFMVGVVRDVEAAYGITPAQG